jgi:hypothetical protein
MKLILGWFLVVNRLFVEGVAIATFFLTSVRGPTAAILSFASPKESIQRKGDPDAALMLRAEAFGEGFRKGHPWPSENERHPCRSPDGLFSSKAPVLGAANGITTATLTTVICLSVLALVSWPNNSFACKSLGSLPSFPLEELKEYDQIYVVNVETVNYSKPLNESWYAPNFDFEGRIVEVLKGTGKSGDIIQGATDSTQEPHARCPILLEAGKTYLLFLLGNSSPYVLPRFGSLHIPSSDSSFRRYVTDIRRAQKKRHKKQQ